MEGKVKSAIAAGEPIEKIRLYPIGDYYEWFCESCDSQNLTFWANIDTHGHIVCGACQHRYEFRDAC